jgi:hypothetical protein
MKIIPLIPVLGWILVIIFLIFNINLTAKLTAKEFYLALLIQSVTVPIFGMYILNLLLNN